MNLDNWKPIDQLLGLKHFEVWIPYDNAPNGGYAVPAVRCSETRQIVFLSSVGVPNGIRPTHFRERSGAPIAQQLETQRG